MLDGLGLWEYPAEDLTIYRDVREHDLDKPLPALGRKYDAVVCGEALHLLTNPGLVLAGFADSLKPGGSVIITTPNTWHARSRGQFFLRGFHSGFSPNYGKKRGDYITYFPFSFPQLHLLLTHAGFSNVKLHEVAEPKPKRIVERLLALPGRIYCERKRREAETMDEAAYWGTLAARSRSLVDGLSCQPRRASASSQCRCGALESKPAFLRASCFSMSHSRGPQGRRPPVALRRFLQLDDKPVFRW